MCNGRGGEEQIPLQDHRMIQATIVAATQDGGPIRLRNLKQPGAINRWVASIPSGGTEVVVHVEAREEVEREDSLELHDAVIVDSSSRSVGWHKDCQLLLAESSDKGSLVCPRRKKRIRRRNAGYSLFQDNKLTLYVWFEW